jgi:O-antigen ligase
MAAIFFSTARGAWLAALAAVATCVVLLGRRAVSRGTGLVLAALLAAVAFAAATSPELTQHARSMFDPGGINAGRVAIYRANLDIVADHPVLGLGFGRYRTAATPYYQRHPAADRRSHAHNTYLHLAAEAGLVGLAAFGLLFATALLRGARALRAGDRLARATAAGAWAGIVGFLVGGLTQYNLADNEVALGMWVALAVLMRLREEA